MPPARLFLGLPDRGASFQPCGSLCRDRTASNLQPKFCKRNDFGPDLMQSMKRQKLRQPTLGPNEVVFSVNKFLVIVESGKPNRA